MRTYDLTNQAGITIRNFVKLIMCRVKEKPKAFRDIPLKRSDYEKAAENNNLYWSAEIQGLHINFLISAITENENALVFTTDDDRFSSMNYIICVYDKQNIRFRSITALWFYEENNLKNHR
jgi:hypothetical protein